MHTTVVQWDEYVNKEMDKHHERLACHRHNLETMRQQIRVLKEENFEKHALIDSMADKLCHCHASPRLVKSGTHEEPFTMDNKLEYEGFPIRITPLCSPLLLHKHLSPSLILECPFCGTLTRRIVSQLVVPCRFWSGLL